MQFSSPVTGIVASPDLVVVVGGTPASVNNLTISAGKLIVEVDQDVSNQLIDVTYNPDGALTFANGGDVPVSATYEFFLYNP